MSGILGGASAGVRVSGIAAMSDGLRGGMRMRGDWRVRAFAPGRFTKSGIWIPGDQIEERVWKNVVCDEGLDAMLDRHLSAGTQITAWYLALLTGTPTVNAASTYANLMGGGNSEFTNYDEAARQTWSDGGVSGQSVDNSGSPATFTSSGDSQTIGGAALVSVNTKGDTAGGGVLHAGGPFSGGDLVLNTGATLDVTATFTAADDGA